MDSGRIGKALGIGTRVLSKAVVHSLEQGAETSARTNAAAAVVRENAARVQAAAAKAAPAAKESARRAVEATREAAGGAHRVGGSILGSIWRISGVVWLESMGVLFGLLTVFFAQGLWKHYADILLPVHNKLFQNYIVYILATGLFGYFTVSTFVRAEKRSRGKK